MMSEWMPEYEPRPSRIKRNVGVFLLVILIVALVASFLLTWRPGLYSRPEWGFSVEIPSGYTIYTEEENIKGDNRTFMVVFYKSNEIRKGVGVEVHQRGSPMSLENLISKMKIDLQQGLPGSTIVSEGPRQVAGVSAWELVVTHSDPRGTVKNKDICLVDNEGRGYVIFGLTRYEAFAELDPILEQFIQSFKLL